MRIAFVPKDEVAEEPRIEVGEPDNGRDSGYDPLGDYGSVPSKKQAESSPDYDTAACASHSSSFDQRLLPETFFTAMAAALR